MVIRIPLLTSSLSMLFGPSRDFIVAATASHAKIYSSNHRRTWKGEEVFADIIDSGICCTCIM